MSFRRPARAALFAAVLTAVSGAASAAPATPATTKHPHHATKATAAQATTPGHTRVSPHPVHAPASKAASHAHRATSHPTHATRHRTVAKAAAATAAAAAVATAAHEAAPTPTPLPPPDDKGTVTGLKLPRFAALRADEVNLRSGPGTRYPIQWVYRRRDLPVRVEREFDVWRLIEDMDGVKGWVNQATLIGSRGFVATAPLALLRDAPKPDGGLVAVVRAGVVGRLLRCDAPPAGAAAEPLAGPPGVLAAAADSAPVGPPASPGSAVDPAAKPGAAASPLPAAPASSAPTVTDSVGTDAVVAEAVAQAEAGITHPAPADAQPGWCRVRIRDYTGWLPRDALYGVLPGEVIAPS